MCWCVSVCLEIIGELVTISFDCQWPCMNLYNYKLFWHQQKWTQLKSWVELHLHHQKQWHSSAANHLCVQPLPSTKRNPMLNLITQIKFGLWCGNGKTIRLQKYWETRHLNTLWPNWHEWNMNKCGNLGWIMIGCCHITKKSLGPLGV